MTPEEALERIETYGNATHVPEIYREMGLTRLRILVTESRKPGPPSAIDRMPVPRLNYNPLDHALGRPASTPAPAAAPAAEAVETAPPPAPLPPGEPTTLVDRAIARDGRLSTPARRRAAFRRHLARCHTIVEAAARTGIDRRTVARWRKQFPTFDAQCREIIEMRRQQAVEDAVLGVGHVEARPLFYRGRKIGEYTRRHRATDLYLLKRADAAADHAARREEQRHEEQRREAQLREETQRLAKEDFEARVAAEVEKEVARRISEMSRSPRQEAAPRDGEIANASSDIAPAPCDIALAR